MMKILANKMFVAVIFVVVFGVTMVVWVLFFQKAGAETQANAGGVSGTNTVSSTNAVAGATNAVAQHAAEEKHAPAEPAPSAEVSRPAAAETTRGTAFSGSVSEPGSLTFNNPEIGELVKELRRAKSALLAKEVQLNELARRLALEKAEIGGITQEVLKAKAAMMLELTNQVNIMEKTEETRIKALAQVYAGTNMPSSSAVQILNGMEVDEVARLLFFMPYRDQAAILENFATNSLTRESSKATDISQKIRKLADKPKLPNQR